MNEPRGGPTINPKPIDAPMYLIYFSLSSGKFVEINDIAVAMERESPYPWKNLATQLNMKKSSHYDFGIYDSIPRAVLETKMHINPTSIAFLRPIFDMVIA